MIHKAISFLVIKIFVKLGDTLFYLKAPLFCRTSPGNLNQTVTDSANVTDHEITIPGLTPDTTYYYQVGSTSTVLAGGDNDHHFKTNPSIGSQVPVPSAFLKKRRIVVEYSHNNWYTKRGQGSYTEAAGTFLATSDKQGVCKC